ncbi:DUF563 domain-containing protein [Pseudomonadota bacterium]
MVTINWDEIDHDIVLPAHHEEFSIRVENPASPPIGDVHAFNNRGHDFEAIKRTSIKRVTVSHAAGVISNGTSSLTYDRAALLTSEWWFNYSHLMVDMLPMTRFLDNLKLDTILLPPNAAAPQLVELMNLKTRIGFLSEDSSIGVGELYLLSENGPPSMKPSWVPGYLREVMMHERDESGVSSSERLWISRVDTPHRQMRVKASFYARIRERGIRPVVASRLSIKDQIDLFARAELVCGVHGAGFTNVIFSPKRSSLLELFDPYWLNGAFRILCSHRKMNWRYLQGEAYPSSRDNFLRDVKIQPDLVLDAIDKIIIE